MYNTIQCLLEFFLICAINCVEMEYSSNHNMEKAPDIESLFEELKCIQEPDNFFDVYNDVGFSYPTLGSLDLQQTPIYREQLNQLVQYNNLEHSYKVETEDAVSTNPKLFKITLTVGDETYYGTGKSKKEAREVAATSAIQNTQYKKPPVMIKDNSYDEESPPTVVLNNLGLKHGYVIDYYMVDPQVRTRIIDLKKIKDNSQLTNSSFWTEAAHLDVPPKSPFHVEVIVEKDSFYGKGHTIQTAKHSAAMNALQNLKKTGMDLNSPCTTKGMEVECKKSKNKLKSPVSLVYEFATTERINVEFNELKKSGPSHKPIFEFECVLGSLKTQAEGKSKKEAKRNAAEKMLENLPVLETLQQKSDKIREESETGGRKRRGTGYFSFARNILGTIFTGLSENSENDDKVMVDDNEHSEKQNNKKRNKKQRKRDKNQWSPKEKLLETGQALNLNVQIRSMERKKSGFYSIINLNLNPKYICYGVGVNAHIAEEYAALNALNFLYKLDLIENIEEKDLDVRSFSFDNFIWLTEDNSQKL